MLRALVGTANQLLEDFRRSLKRGRLPLGVEDSSSRHTPGPGIRKYQRLEKVYLTDEVNRLILEEFANHRKSPRGNEETGWVLLGVREEREATVLATLPAGAGRDAGVAHVLFNSTAQALACRIIRQWDSRLVMLGVAHTHPGSLRHPSNGDYRGDIQWVGQLRGREGIFAIGTADEKPSKGLPLAHQPRKNRQILGELCLSWYSLHEKDANYRPLPMDLTLGPDMARELRSVWSVVETYAEPLERLACQQTGVVFEVVPEKEGAALAVNFKLAHPGDSLRLLLNDLGARYYLIRDEDLIEVNPKEARIDRAFYLILAELASM